MIFDLILNMQTKNEIEFLHSDLQSEVKRIELMDEENGIKNENGKRTIGGCN